MLWHLRCFILPLFMFGLLFFTIWCEHLVVNSRLNRFTNFDYRGRMAQLIAFSLHTQRPQVRFLAYLSFFLRNPSSILASGKLVLQKKLWLTRRRCDLQPSWWSWRRIRLWPTSWCSPSPRSMWRPCCWRSTSWTWHLPLKFHSHWCLGQVAHAWLGINGE